MEPPDSKSVWRSSIRAPQKYAELTCATNEVKLISPSRKPTQKVGKKEVGQLFPEIEMLSCEPVHNIEAAEQGSNSHRKTQPPEKRGGRRRNAVHFWRLRAHSASRATMYSYMPSSRWGAPGTAVVLTGGARVQRTEGYQCSMARAQSSMQDTQTYMCTSENRACDLSQHAWRSEALPLHPPRANFHVSVGLAPAEGIVSCQPKAGRQRTQVISPARYEWNSASSVSLLLIAGSLGPETGGEGTRSRSSPTRRQCQRSSHAPWCFPISLSAHWCPCSRG